WGEEGGGVIDSHQPAPPCLSGGEPRGERSGGEPEPGLTPDRVPQPPACLADRFAWVDDAAHVEPGDALGPDLDHRRKVVERGRDQLLQPGGGLRIGREKGGGWAKVLRLAERQAGEDPEWERLVGGGEDVVIP